MKSLILFLSLTPTFDKISTIELLVYFNYIKNTKDISTKNENQWQELLTIHDLLK